MSKEQRIRSLTWKYFFQQKKEEIKEHVDKIMMGSLMGAFFSVMIGCGINEAGYKPAIWFAFIGITIFLFWILVGIIMLFKCFFRWLSSNWKEAKGRAIQDIQNEHK